MAKWQTNITGCTVIEYVIESSSPAIASFITLTSSSSNLEFTITSTDPTLKGTQTVTVRGAVKSADGSITYRTASQAYTININSCTDTVITPTAFTILPMTYVISDAAATWTFPAWTESVGSFTNKCGTFTYSITQDDNALDTTLFTFSPTDGTLIAYSLNVAKASSISLKVYGTLTIGGIEQYLLATAVIIDGCPFADLSVTGECDQHFAVSASAHSVILPQYSSTRLNTVCGPFNFSTTVIKDKAGTDLVIGGANNPFTWDPTHQYLSV